MSKMCDVCEGYSETFLEIKSEAFVICADCFSQLNGMGNRLYVVREIDSQIVLIADELEQGELQKIANHFGDVFVIRGTKTAAQHRVHSDAGRAQSQRGEGQDAPRR